MTPTAAFFLGLTAGGIVVFMLLAPLVLMYRQRMRETDREHNRQMHDACEMLVEFRRDRDDWMMVAERNTGRLPSDN